MEKIPVVLLRPIVKLPVKGVASIGTQQKRRILGILPISVKFWRELLQCTTVSVAYAHMQNK